MCKLDEKLKEKTFTGFKVVCKINDKYYSPATGVEYKIGEVEVCKKQKRLTSHFVNSLLFNSYIYSHNMVGRTAVFTRKDDAMALLKNIKKKQRLLRFVQTCFGFPRKFKVVEMTVSENLMSGEYAFCCEVIAGMKIDNIKEL